jgi:hypothetical protein
MIGNLTVPWLRRFVVGLSPRRSGFAAKSASGGFVVNKVGLGQVFYEFLVLPRQFHSTGATYTIIWG